MKSRIVAGVYWLQVNLPVLAPFLDRVLHTFGFCIGH